MTTQRISESVERHSASDYLYFILSSKLQLDLSPVLWPLGGVCECVPSLPSEKSHPSTSERSKLLLLWEALYLIHHCGVWPLSGSELSVATKTWCVWVPLPSLLFTSGSLRNTYLLCQPILICYQRQDSCRMGGADVPFSIQKSHWCILLTSWGLTWFLNLISRSHFARDQAAQARCERFVVLALLNSRRWGTCPKITQKIKQVCSFLWQKHRLPVLWISFPTVHNTFFNYYVFYFKLQILN